MTGAILLASTPEHDARLERALVDGAPIIDELAASARVPPTVRSSTTTRASPRSSATSRPSASCPTCGSGRGRRRAVAGRGPHDRFAPCDPVDVRLVAVADQPARLVRPGPRARGVPARARRRGSRDDRPPRARLAVPVEPAGQRRDEPGQGGHGRRPALRGPRHQPGRRPPLGRHRDRIPAHRRAPGARDRARAAARRGARPAARRRAPQSLRRLPVRAPGPPARPVARPRRRPTRTGSVCSASSSSRSTASRPGSRAPASRGPRRPRRPAPPGRGARAGRGRTSGQGRERSPWPSRTCSGRAAGSWPSIATPTRSGPTRTGCGSGSRPRT